ncbi:NUDIX domain-containing protein [Klebsiella sp. BIGb0407]|uniref:NUDIX hydrolase n=1 Tax=Klebsiella sp. BIGb0407 TaxID=2940603 RepID=UPI002169D1EB|nr:NUDIX domain-containing protein [Klebsiella sp. BIGb0407]MCS3432590.1 8-oxo-dGTP pyrophosphatase MutT (NUDIX family) [Klebsiella sp. BIGb0407]
MSANQQIHVSAAVITDSEGRILLVRKRNTSFFMQPGGKPDAGETAEQALIRELNEELQLEITPEQLHPLGQFTDIAANEANHTVIADMFRIDTIKGDIVPAAEIEEILWLSPADSATHELAPLTLNKVIPLLSRIG